MGLGLHKDEGNPMDDPMERSRRRQTRVKRHLELSPEKKKVCCVDRGSRMNLGVSLEAD